MHQDALFHDDIDDALGSLVMALGGYQKVAAELWPAMKLESAYARLKNCLREDKPEKLSPQEVIFLMKWGRDESCHVAMHYMADATGYDRPKAKTPEEHETDLLRRENEHLRAALKLSQRRLAVVNGD